MIDTSSVMGSKNRLGFQFHNFASQSDVQEMCKELKSKISNLLKITIKISLDPFFINRSPHFVGSNPIFLSFGSESIAFMPPITIFGQ